jgi:hypothetical protein
MPRRENRLSIIDRSKILWLKDAIGRFISRNKFDRSKIPWLKDATDRLRIFHKRSVDVYIILCEPKSSSSCAVVMGCRHSSFVRLKVIECVVSKFSINREGTWELRGEIFYVIIFLCNPLMHPFPLCFPES